MGILSGLHRADAAVVGGGLTGLLLGAALSAEGMRVTVIDAGAGASKASAGVATVLRAPLFDRIQAAHGADTARRYAEALQSQLRALTAAPLPYVRETPVYAYSLSERDLSKLEQQHEQLTTLNLPVNIAPDAGGCPFPVELSLMCQGQALVDAGRWMSALQRAFLLRGGRMYTDSRVIAIDGTRVCTKQGCVDAPLIILAAGKPLGVREKRLLALLETRLLASCTMTSTVPLHSCQQSVREDGFTLHPTAMGAVATWDAGRIGSRQQRDRLTAFEQLLRSRLPDWQRGEIHYSQDVYPLDGLPVIGTLPGTQLLCAAGYSGCGVLGAMHAAEVLTRRILGRALPEDAAYSPDRRLPQGILRPQMRRLTGIYARNLLRRNAPSCAHCDCRMRYSTAAQRWECPYCGSVYTMLGIPLAGPTMRAAQISVRQRPDL